MLRKMAVRKASSYSKKTLRPNTRNSRTKRKAYIKVIPFSKIVKFTMGSEGDFRAGKHPFVLKLIMTEAVQIRDIALEASRMLLHKILEETVPGQYFAVMKVQPHHFMRENKVATGAGADRMKCGMTQSFGIVIGRAAIVKPNQPIILVSCANEKAARVARDALATIKSKVPGKTRISFEKMTNPFVSNLPVTN